MGYKKTLEDEYMVTRTSSDGLPYCKGLSIANAEYVLKKLKLCDGAATPCHVVDVFLKNFEDCLKTRTAHLNIE